MWRIFCIRNIAFRKFKRSHGGSLLIYALQGSDFFTIYVRPTSAPLASTDDAEVSCDKNQLSDEIRFVKFSGIAWTHDSKGFFYQVSSTVHPECNTSVHLPVPFSVIPSGHRMVLLQKTRQERKQTVI